MASAATHLPDMLEALRSGALPARLSADRTAFAFPTLAYSDARGAAHCWTVSVRLLGPGPARAPVAIGDEMLGQPVPDLAGHLAEIRVVSQQRGGKVRDVVPTYVGSGKNRGKKNATNPLTQALRDALGLYNKQRKRAGVSAAAPAAAPEAPDTPEALGSEALDTEALDTEAPDTPRAFDANPPPMLVKKAGDSREATLTADDFRRGVTVQRKLNGVHYVAYARPGPRGALVRYSRTGTEYPGQEHIAQELAAMIDVAPPVAPGAYGTPAGPSTEKERRILEAYGALPSRSGCQGGGPRPYFAGELYLHGESLNWISGQARRADDEGRLEYHIFDVFFPYAKAAGHDMASRHRQAYLAAFFAAAAGLAHPHVVPVENVPARSMSEVEAYAEQFVREGYEGAIARKDDAGYRYSYNNYHAAHAVKIKPKYDDEFPVVGYTQGTRGKDEGAVVWVCEVPGAADPRDNTFNVVPKSMTYETRYRLYRCLGELVPDAEGRLVTRFERDVKGLPLTVEYAELSAKTKKPLQAKAVTFRTYEAGPEKDPMRQLLAGCGVV